ncbi:tRNA (adenosine(37)-N6)-threonylcarbamoyltransferase complex transferase subunit TsaD [Spiroplasma sp. BIUS-1]|uniref:tRNA (adenosine(37)-N6)-threonylcarbamoyltransferase complex transferase subunit TsaD n=1 Tax=Spiroplasma sp. BIUS-1 TaxID=216964 RepID=UPI00139901E6|nr:tRNA (adenosine(37)-N6)-threonylcarbamoyltransferase complex transferase subunit TsaD [Spiroplasma sp. BIUS-1]QHX36339.1 N6-L-threonylcarbamoyladenine synthase [Spiroplasma sp. BIUS-1]
MKILAIESSCDEFSISIMQDGNVLSNVISSQIKEHSEFGGVVPELASRLHVDNFHWVLTKSLYDSKVSLEEIDYISYTSNPGLIGSLIIGKLVAQTLAMFLNKPLMEMNHIQGHIYGANIEEKFEYPVLALVVSGGHTQIQWLEKPLDFKIIGSTQDDAVGECYDKVARVLGLKYPGGPKIDELSKKGDSSKYKLPISKNDNTYDFSFSGLKTASLNLINKLNQNKETLNIEDFCASFQKTAIETLMLKFEKAVNEYKPKTITVVGGVSANSSVRENIFKIGEKYKINKIIVPNMEYCTDNAAMIAELTNEYLKLK